MSEAKMNSYRLTSMEEPGDERMAAGINEAAHEARAKVAETLRRLRNGDK